MVGVVLHCERIAEYEECRNRFSRVVVGKVLSSRYERQGINSEELEELYGPEAAYSDHRKGKRITFTEEGHTRKGKIIWVCAPWMAVGKKLVVRYIVEMDGRKGVPGKILEDG